MPVHNKDTADALLRLFTELLSFLKDVGFLGTYSLTFAHGDNLSQGLGWYDDVAKRKFISIMLDIKSLISEWENKGLKQDRGAASPSCSAEVSSPCHQEDFQLDLSSSFEDFEKENIPETTQLKQALFPELCTPTEIRVTSPNESKILINFKCDLCHKSFSTKAHLRRHIEAHSGHRLFNCDMCGKSYAAKQGLATHLLREHNFNTGETFSCDFCGKIFAIRAALNKHRQIHEATKPFSCHICHKGFSQKINRDAHVALHTGDLPIACPHCPKRFALPSKLNKHIVVHQEPKFQCSFCSKKFNRNFCLQQHMKLHENNRPFGCNTCGKSFVTKYKLDVHKQTHILGWKHMCDICGSQFRQKSTLILHIRRHTQEGLHVCSFCNKSYVKQYDLQRHILTHSSTRDFLCDACGKDFKTPGDLHDHRRKIHFGIDVPKRKKTHKLYQCKYCPKQFKTTSRMSTHKRQHLENPRFECNTCGKKFHRSDVYKQHLFRHTGNRPFTCTKCNKTFASITNYKAHALVHEMQTAHFACDICNKAYRRQSSLNAHLKKHSSDKAALFECHICHGQFETKLCLGNHLKIHTLDRPFPCLQCNKRYKTKKHLREHMRKIHPATECNVETEVMPEIQVDLSLGTNFEAGAFELNQQDQFAGVEEMQTFSPIQDLETLRILQQLTEGEAAPSNRGPQPPADQNFLLQCVEETILADAPSLLADLSNSLATLPPDSSLL